MTKTLGVQKKLKCTCTSCIHNHMCKPPKTLLKNTTSTTFQPRKAAWYWNFQEDSTKWEDLKRFNCCANCQKVCGKKRLGCLRCPGVYYCDAKCQEVHWSQHKRICPWAFDFKVVTFPVCADSETCQRFRKVLRCLKKSRPWYVLLALLHHQILERRRYALRLFIHALEDSYMLMVLYDDAMPSPLLAPYSTIPLVLQGGQFDARMFRLPALPVSYRHHLDSRELHSYFASLPLEDVLDGKRILRCNLGHQPDLLVNIITWADRDIARSFPHLILAYRNHCFAADFFK